MNYFLPPIIVGEFFASAPESWAMPLWGVEDLRKLSDGSGVITLNPAAPTAEGVAVASGRIVAVGGAQDGVAAALPRLALEVGVVEAALDRRVPGRAEQEQPDEAHVSAPLSSALLSPGGATLRRAARSAACAASCATRSTRSRSASSAA